MIKSDDWQSRHNNSQFNNEDRKSRVKASTRCSVPSFLPSDINMLENQGSFKSSPVPPSLISPSEIESKEEVGEKLSEDV
jgi:hypothetical protein